MRSVGNNKKILDTKTQTMKKNFFILSFLLLIGCKSFDQKTQLINADSTITTTNQMMTSKHKAFLNRFYQFDNGKLGYMPHVILKSNYSFENDFEKILELSNKTITQDSHEYSRKLFPKSVVDRYFEFDNLDTITIVSFNETFNSKAHRSDIEYYENNIEGQYITSFELLQQPSKDYQDFYGYKIWDNNLIKTVKQFFHQQQDSLLDMKILENKNIDKKYLYKSEQWIDNDSKVLYGFISFSNEGFTKYSSILYKSINDSIVLEKEFYISPLVIWSVFPSCLKYKDESVLLVKFAEPDTDYIVDDVIYFNGKTFIQGDNNMID
ncbi:MAG TPA: hypothetical protein GXZ70_10010 [Clostridiales bacterium]|nr:hypothetical protein [Clostridiales bacterium]